jgi:WD40 repeat protein
LLVDQFEEIFRFRQSGDKTGQEASHFIQLLLETARQTEFPIFIILTMRSDFLGDCAEFKGLAEAVNEGEYLIPRLNRKQRARAIEGPVKVGGAEISPRLKQQLLNDIGDDPDQLPILQHALMRMWDYWLNNANREQALDLDHYNGIGRMTEALSRHGDEVYEELPDDNHRLLCMKLFKAITEKQGDGRGVRRPLPFSEIDEITGHQREKILTVIDAYRPIGRTFIMPGQNVKIHDKIIIDISHESLMRVWQRLKNWVNDEADSARIYIRLCETAQLHNRGEAGFYRDPDLKIALAWRDNNKPNANWGTRINDSFELAMRFLDDSSEDFEAEQKAKEEARKRELEQAKALAEAEKNRAEIQRKSAKRNKVFAGVLFLLAVFAGVMAYQATQAEKRAIASEKDAKNNLSFSYVFQADQMLRSGQAGKAIALMGQQFEQNPEYDIIPEKLANHLNHQPFLRESKRIYENGEDILLRARKGFVYTADYSKCYFLHNSRKQSYIKCMKTGTDEVILKTGLLNSVDELNCGMDGNRVFVTGADLDGNFVGLIVDGTTGEFIKRYSNKNPITSIIGSNDLSKVMVGDQNGELKIYDARNDTVLFEKKFGGKVHQLKISPDQRSAAALILIDDTYYDVIHMDLDTFEHRVCYSSPRNQLRHEAWVQYSLTGKYFIQFGGNPSLGYISVFNGKTGKHMWENDTSHTRVMITADISHDETIVATPSLDASVRLWDIETGQEISDPLQHDGGVWYSIFSPDQTKIATLTDQNDIWVWSAKNGKILNFPTRQKEELVAIAFNQKGDKLFSATITGTFLEWDLNTPTVKPIILTHDAVINSHELSNDGRWVVTGARDKAVKIWDVNNLREHKSALSEFEVGIIALNTNNDALTVFESMGIRNAKKWSIYSFPDLTIKSSGMLPLNTVIGQVSPDGKIIAYANKDNSLTVHNAELDKQLYTINEHNGWVEGIQFSPDSSIFVTLCRDSQVRAFNLKTGKLKYQKTFGGLYGSKCKFSNDGKMFIVYAQIGSDSGTPIAFDSETGKELFRLSHENGVSEVSFSEDDKFLFSGSRDFTAKQWDISNIENPINTYNVGDWVMSVVVNPDYENRIFTMSRNGNIFVYDTETQLFADGPFRGSSRLSFIAINLLAKPNVPYLVAFNTQTSVALWPYASTKPKVESDSALVDFSVALSGVEMDESMALKVEANRIHNIQSKAEALNGDPNVEKWKSWQLTGDESKNPFGSIDRNAYREFLIKQNTLTSLEEILYSDPMNKEVLALYAKKLLEASEDEELKTAIRNRYRVSAAWYEAASK